MSNEVGSVYEKEFANKEVLNMKKHMIKIKGDRIP
jgi:hypothetical protein